MKVALTPSQPVWFFFLVFIMVINFRCTTTSTTSSACNQDPEPKNDYAKRLKATNHFLDSAVAAGWIARYQQYIKDNSAGGQRQPGAPAAANPVFPKESESFNRALIQQILCLDSCIGVRILLGINDNNEVRFLLGGIDQEGKLLYIADSGKAQAGLRSDRAPAASATSTKGLGEMGQIP